VSNGYDDGCDGGNARREFNKSRSRKNHSVRKEPDDSAPVKLAEGRLARDNIARAVRFLLKNASR